MRSKLLLIIVFVFTYNGILSQPKYVKPDFHKIQTEVKNPNSKLFLPNLLNRFKIMDCTLSNEEIQYLYYGYRMSYPYNPLSYDEKLSKMKQIEAANDVETIKLCDAELQKDIFDMDFFIAKSVSQYELKKDKALSEKQFNFYYNFCKAIHKSGNGYSTNNPIYIINANHIGFLANLIGYKLNGFNKVRNNMMVVGLEKNSFNTSDLYFDISISKEVIPVIAENSFSPKNTIETSITQTDKKATNAAISEPITAPQEIKEEPKEEPSEMANERLARRDEMLSLRKRMMEERIAAKQKLIEERAAAREKLLEEKKAARERLLQEREEQKKGLNDSSSQSITKN